MTTARDFIRFAPVLQQYEYRPDLCPVDHYHAEGVICPRCGTDMNTARRLRSQHDMEDKLRDIAANGH